MIVQRSSKHHPRGTKVLVPATVDGERCKRLMIEDVILAMKARIPRPEGHTIFVEQDGAKSHTKGGNMEAIEEAVGNDIVIENQSVNSSDLNINSLGFFHSILQLKEDVGVTNSGCV
ncbi:unnamed protein product [Choristocarpus tenellus]